LALIIVKHLVNNIGDNIRVAVHSVIYFWGSGWGTWEGEWWSKISGGATTVVAKLLIRNITM